MPHNASGFYLSPPVWIGEIPARDKANIDVTQINREVYRTRLHIGIEVRVLQEGMFVFDFSQWEPTVIKPLEVKRSFDQAMREFKRLQDTIHERISILNTYLVCLYSSITEAGSVIQKVMTISPENLLAFSSFEDEINGMSGSNDYVMELATTRFPSTYGLYPNTVDWRLRHRHLISIDIIQKSFELFDQILQKDISRYLFETYLHAGKAFGDADFSQSLINSWIVIESLLGFLWGRYIEQNRNKLLNGKDEVFISKRRKEKLTDHSSFTISVVTEVLSLTNTISFQVYERIEAARRSRNNWVHRAEKVDSETAHNTILLVADLFKMVEGMRIIIPPISSSGYTS